MSQYPLTDFEVVAGCACQDCSASRQRYEEHSRTAKSLGEQKEATGILYQSEGFRNHALGALAHSIEAAKAEIARGWRRKTREEMTEVIVRDQNAILSCRVACNPEDPSEANTLQKYLPQIQVYARKKGEGK